MNIKEDLEQYLLKTGAKYGTDEYFALIKNWAEKRELMILAPIMAKIAEHLPKKPLVIAIDGRSCAGKSTLAAILSLIYPARVVHMDDFFLPQALRTKERYGEPGGNVHYERFKEEVLPYLRSGEAFSYRKFNCRLMDYAGEVLIKKAPLIIVEGAYSLHPALGEYYDWAAFLDIEPEAQLKRLIKRNTPEMVQNFQEKWLPLEEKYFTDLAIKQKCLFYFPAFE